MTHHFCVRPGHATDIVHIREAGGSIVSANSGTCRPCSLFGQWLQGSVIQALVIIMLT